MPHQHIVLGVDLGRTSYMQCWDLQRRAAQMRFQGKIPDTLLLTEHDHVYTLGTGGDADHLLASEKELRGRGADFVRTDRGGDITYHGPGQLVGYPILNLTAYYKDLHRYLRDLEEVVILTLGEFALRGSRVPGYTGVWVGGDKICALGIRTSRWITMHGFALNVSTDLSYFGRIIPCGIFEMGVTSMEEALGRQVPMGEVASALRLQFGRVFGVRVKEAHCGAFERLLDSALCSEEMPAV